VKSGLRQRFDPCGQTGHFPRCGVLVIDALVNAAHQLWLSGTQSGDGCGFVTRFDGFFRGANERTNTGATGFVNFKTTLVLTGAFFFAWGEFAMI
jgi:hypothetical protein